MLHVAVPDAASGSLGSESLREAGSSCQLHAPRRRAASTPQATPPGPSTPGMLGKPSSDALAATHRATTSCETRRCLACGWATTGAACSSLRAWPISRGLNESASRRRRVSLRPRARGLPWLQHRAPPDLPRERRTLPPQPGSCTSCSTAGTRYTRGRTSTELARPRRQCWSRRSFWLTTS